jgi:hypothetical protein
MWLARRKSPDGQTVLSIAVLTVLTTAIYLPVKVLWGSQTLFGWDYMMLHVRRIKFARDALFGSGHFLPGWYPRELMGTPFSANLQSFPWIPTRLAILAIDPERAYAFGVTLAAVLAALFTYLYLRRAGLRHIAAVTAGWTFACSGFFASRVTVGHLPLLEAYLSVPLLLWLVDRALDQRVRNRASDIAALACASACIALAGHPQLPIYAFVTAFLYIVFRGRGWIRAKLSLVMVLGVGAAAVIWWPMIELIRRSTRVLRLDTPSNDIVMPYRRLLALVAPGIDGWPPGAGEDLYLKHPFTAHVPIFWDTVGYIGLLPLVAIALLVSTRLIQKRRLSSRWMFFAALGGAAMICALPVIDPLRQLLPGNFLRSPSRLLYLWTFCVSVGLGVSVDAVLKWRLRHRVLVPAIVAGCLAFHAWDLGTFARLFIHTTAQQERRIPEFGEPVARGVQDGRIAISRLVSLDLAHRYDDAGGFDSIFLADPYRSVFAMTGSPPYFNEVVDAAAFPKPALQATGVRFVITWEMRPDLELVKSAGGLQLYRVAQPAPRASFFPLEEITFRPRNPSPDRDTGRGGAPYLFTEDRELLRLAPAPGASLEPGPVELRYSRPSSDRMSVDVTTARSGVVYLVEAFDPGWTAFLDGGRIRVFEANGFAMAIPITAGTHSLRLSYHTPGRITGAILSLLSVCVLAGLLVNRKTVC